MEARTQEEDRTSRMDTPGMPAAKSAVDKIIELPFTEESLADTTDADDDRRGRLKRRRMSSHSPPRAASPSRGHDRDSASRYRRHHRKHRRRSSSESVTPPLIVKKNRRRSDAESDHTLRGRARNRSGDRTRNPILEETRNGRRRSPPPSRRRSDGEVEGTLRRQRSLPNVYQRASFGETVNREGARGKGVRFEGGVK